MVKGTPGQAEEFQLEHTAHGNDTVLQHHHHHGARMQLHQRRAFQRDRLARLDRCLARPMTAPPGGRRQGDKLLTRTTKSVATLGTSPSSSQLRRKSGGGVIRGSGMPSGGGNRQRRGRKNKSRRAEAKALMEPMHTVCIDLASDKTTATKRFRFEERPSSGTHLKESARRGTFNSRATCYDEEEMNSVCVVLCFVRNYSSHQHARYHYVQARRRSRKLSSPSSIRSTLPLRT